VPVNTAPLVIAPAIITVRRQAVALPLVLPTLVQAAHIMIIHRAVPVTVLTAFVRAVAARLPLMIARDRATGIQTV